MMKTLKRFAKVVWFFSQLLYQRINKDGVTLLAGHLAYVSLLSLVPFIAVIFSLFALFPVFSVISGQLKSFIFANFIPATGDVIQGYLEQFVANSSKMTAIGSCGLIVTSLLLIYAVDNVLNKIWASGNKRPVMFSFAIYWTVLTLGPILLVASVAVSSYLLSMEWLNVSSVHNVVENALRILPFLISCAAFWLLYSVVPTVRVPLRDALIGAVVASLLFELGKKGFALYVMMFPTYQLIYGVLAVIPILFLWVYVSWCIVLVGAEFTVVLGECRRLHKLQHTHEPLP
jgi:membrane protein